MILKNLYSRVKFNVTQNNMETKHKGMEMCEMDLV
jgi:hypothetical protein